MEDNKQESNMEQAIRQGTITSENPLYSLIDLLELEQASSSYRDEENY